jgi:hypothetical protein
MHQREVEEDRRCRKCLAVLHATAAALKEHSATCIAFPEDVKAAQRALRLSLPKIHVRRVSNRERQRLAQRAIMQMTDMKILLLAVLAQKGGEVLITKGTIAQLTEDMNYEVVPCPDDEQTKIIRIVKGAEHE